MSISRHLIVVAFAVAVLCGCRHTPLTERVAGLDGLAEAQLVSRYGVPGHREEYPMSQAAGEFRTGLQHYFPMPRNRDVRIRELTWDLPQHHLTAWLRETNGQWFTFDSLRYQRGVQF
jgi:hypothetical protein